MRNTWMRFNQAISNNGSTTSLQCNPSIILLVTRHLFTENLQIFTIIFYQMLIKWYELQKIHELNPDHLKIHLQHVIYN